MYYPVQVDAFELDETCPDYTLLFVLLHFSGHVVKWQTQGTQHGSIHEKLCMRMV